MLPTTPIRKLDKLYVLLSESKRNLIRNNRWTSIHIEKLCQFQKNFLWPEKIWDDDHFVITSRASVLQTKETCSSLGAQGFFSVPTYSTWNCRRIARHITIVHRSTNPLPTSGIGLIFPLSSQTYASTIPSFHPSSSHVYRGHHLWRVKKTWNWILKKGTHISSFTNGILKSEIPERLIGWFIRKLLITVISLATEMTSKLKS